MLDIFWHFGVTVTLAIFFKSTCGSWQYCTGLKCLALRYMGSSENSLEEQRRQQILRGRPGCAPGELSEGWDRLEKLIRGAGAGACPAPNPLLHGAPHFFDQLLGTKVTDRLMFGTSG